MAVTHGHGNPNWTRDETILALELYHKCKESIPSNKDKKVQALSALLRSFPYHALAARKESFRNPDGVVFKLQNLRQIETGKGLGNTSKIDRQVWDELGEEPRRTKELAEIIRSSIRLVESIEEDSDTYEVFIEGKMATSAHLRRERNPRIRKILLAQRKKYGPLTCEMCGCQSVATFEVQDAMFEAHHIIPLSVSLENSTKLKDIALLCANCHKMIHKAISMEKRWLTVSEATEIIFGS